MPETIFKLAYPMVVRAVAVRTAAIRLELADREDAQQQVALGVWRALARYDPARSSLKTFTESVTRNELVSFLRRARNRSRLHAPLDLIEGTLRAPDWHPELRADSSRVLDTVSPFDRQVALSLADSSPLETSRGLAVSRAATYRAIHRLRSAFASAGLGPARLRTCRRGPTA